MRPPLWEPRERGWRAYSWGPPCGLQAEITWGWGACRLGAACWCLPGLGAELRLAVTVGEGGTRGLRRGFSQSTCLPEPPPTAVALHGDRDAGVRSQLSSPRPGVGKRGPGAGLLPVPVACPKGPRLLQPSGWHALIHVAAGSPPTPRLRLFPAPEFLDVPETGCVTGRRPGAPWDSGTRSCLVTLASPASASPAVWLGLHVDTAPP